MPPDAVYTFNALNRWGPGMPPDAVYTFNALNRCPRLLLLTERIPQDNSFSFAAFSSELCNLIAAFSSELCNLIATERIQLCASLICLSQFPKNDKVSRGRVPKNDKVSRGRVQARITFTSTVSSGECLSGVFITVDISRVSSANCHAVLIKPTRQAFKLAIYSKMV
ncbi:hypothetical protein QE152_g6358 [Popillia japonica]|uniref:Uncharacterized protein n=1 Tax=Popillia japonica TaxID=7064 RepID=A0AAW1MJ56_POPJA